MKKQFFLVSLLLGIVFSSNFVYSQNYNPAFFQNLKTCKPDSYTYSVYFMEHEFKTTKAIYGMQNNLCSYKETFSKGTIDCRLPVSFLGTFSNYLQANMNGTNFSTEIQSNGNKLNSKGTIDGKPIDNALDYAFDKGYCKYQQ